MKTTKQFYLVFNDDHKEGTIINDKEHIKKLRQPVTFQAFPIELKEQMQHVLEQEHKKIKAMH